METNFFKTLTGLAVTGDFILNIHRQEDGTLTVSVLLQSGKVGDKAAKTIPPMVFKGTAEELDKGFFPALEQPLKQTAGLFANMEQYLKQVEEARLQSQMEKDKGDKERKEKEERKKKYEAMMKKVDEHEAEKKYTLAISALPKAEQFPEQAEQISGKLENLRKANGQLSLM